MRPIRTTVLAAAVVSAALGIAACGGSSGGAAAPKHLALSPVAEVRNASLETTKAGTATFSMAVTTVAGGQSVAFTGNGQFDYRRSVGRITMTLPTSLTAGKTQTVDEIVTKGAIYMSGTMFGQPDKWVRVDLAKIGLSGLSTGADPSQVTKLLATVSTVTKVGAESVGGVPATHYRGSIDIDKALAAVSPQLRSLEAKAGSTLPKALPFDSWVDAQGRLVKLTEVLPVGAGTSGQPTEVHLTMTLGGFGKPVTVTVPTGSQLVTLPGISS